ncbi:MAG: RDD family protein [Sedimentisphaerales bacterium]
MDTRKCKSCGQEFQEWVEFCSNCAEPMEGYSRPAGFWIRVGATLIDWLIFIPIGMLSIWNIYSLKNTAVLVLISLPALLYKPLMESFFGATLGKMSCKIKVIDDNGKKLSLFGAYVRFFPFLIQNGINLVGQLIVFSSPQFQSATSMIELQEAQQANYLNIIGLILIPLVIIECVFAAFTFRKRALHDMLAESFCVYKEP